MAHGDQTGLLKVSAYRREGLLRRIEWYLGGQVSLVVHMEGLDGGRHLEEDLWANHILPYGVYGMPQAQGLLLQVILPPQNIIAMQSQAHFPAGSVLSLDETGKVPEGITSKIEAGYAPVFAIPVIASERLSLKGRSLSCVRHTRIEYV